jgi:uncharacterized membrane protein YraQ (UPF0718 family)
MSTTTTAPVEPPRSSLRRWAPVAGAAVVWWLLYSYNRPFWDWEVFDVAGMDADSHWGEAVHFFFYDVSKIALLLSGVIFLVTVLRSFMSVERTRALLGGRREGVGNAAAAGLGVVTPFCSCSAVPVFMGFVAAGVPLGGTLSFLIASPMVNEVAIVLLFGQGLSWDDRLLMAREEVVSILHKVWPYLLVGIGVGAVIHGWAPEEWFAEHATGLLGVPIAVGIGVPLYSNAAGVIPLVEVLYDKGMPMGTPLAFMMSVVALSLPQMILLRRVLEPKLIATYVGVVASGILVTGLMFNLVI